MATLDYRFYPGKDLYSDGDIEDELLDIVSKHNEEEIQQIASKDTRWAIYYHLSKERGSILDVVDFKDNDEVLEIGSGCGAITTSLVKKCKSLTCVELSKRRSLINAERNKNADNLLIYVGNFNEIELDKKYDKIFLIGVLEYAKLYFPGHDDPFSYFLEKIHTLLKDNGKAYIAIENKYGMKYFSGAREDHEGSLFESIEGYKKESSANTFSYFQLKEMLEKNGYGSSYFYFPLPDYKFPKTIYSEDWLPSEGEIQNISYSFDRERYVIFNEEKALNESLSSKTFHIFANSFLVEATKVTK